MGMPVEAWSTTGLINALEYEWYTKFSRKTLEISKNLVKDILLKDLPSGKISKNFVPEKSQLRLWVEGLKTGYIAVGKVRETIWSWEKALWRSR